MQDGNSFLTPEEIYLFNQGELYRSYRKFGAHFIEVKGEAGIHFAVWIPGVVQVCVVGEFNGWCGSSHRMKPVGQTGVWVLFIPGLCKGEFYKYEVHTPTNECFLKSDPYAVYSECRPATASILYSLSGFLWGDQEWLQSRKQNGMKEAPLLIYEAHLGSWKRKEGNRYYRYREFAEAIIPYLSKMGYTHLELLPLMEHPYDGSWGYQGTGYYACTSRYGTPHELMSLIDLCHQAGIGVILDWVPGHFCQDVHGLGKFNGESLYERDVHEHWGTYRFDLSRTEVWSFLISNALFWFDQFHVDGLRVDGVSSMLYLDYGKEGRPWCPNIYGGRENLDAVAFMQRLNDVVSANYPDVMMIAEEATDWPLVSFPTSIKGLGYQYKWNMGWMNDTLRYVQLDFSERRDHHQLLTFSLMYAFSENFILPLSHDEVVHGKRSLLDKMPGDYWKKFAGLRTLYGYLICHPGKKLIFMGHEFAQFIEWREDQGLDWLLLDYEMHHKHLAFTQCLNTLYREERALWENDQNWEGFEWIDVNNYQQSILVFCRRAKNPLNFLVVLINFQPIAYEHYRIGIPSPGTYEEIFNSDDYQFGGSDCVNRGTLVSEPVPWHGREFSLEIMVPPLATVIFKPHF